jgi:hypothetical protein
MTATYEPIATETLGTAQASVTFSSIPATYTDLVLVFNGTIASGVQNMELRFNGDTATNYSETRFFGTGAATSTDRTSTTNQIRVGNIYTTQTVNIIQIMNYANATTFKTVLVRSNNAGAQVSVHCGLWRKSPEAITSVFVRPAGGVNFAIGSTFTLYGIKAA